MEAQSGSEAFLLLLSLCSGRGFFLGPGSDGFGV